MTGSITLDVVIGLVFIYLLYSLLATIVQEALANVFSFRSKFLEKAIIRMLEDGNSRAASSLPNRFVGFFRMFFRRKDSHKFPFAASFYHHPLIKYLAEDDYKSKPSYLTGRNFSKTIIDLLRGNDFKAGDDPKIPIQRALNERKLQWKHDSPKLEFLNHVVINRETADYLRSLWADAGGDVDKFRSLIEEWFDVTMERTTGWYKKHIQGVLLLIGFAIAMTFNVDSIRLSAVLARDPDLRGELVKQAGNYIKSHREELKREDPAVKQKAQKLILQADALLKKDVANVNKTLGLGWYCKTPKKHRHHFLPGNKFCIRSHISFSSLLGWFITAFALSLGAPFWFDLLNKLMKLRGTINSNDKEAPEPKSNPKKAGGAS